MAISRAMDTLQEMGSRGNLFLGATIGTVVSTSDPQQMGRLYVHCVELGDPPTLRSEDIEQLPLCTYISPFAGFGGSTLTRGPEQESTTEGPTPYGFWAIPRRGDQVLVMCIDGDPSQRVWIGAMYGQFVTNALPHGRFWFDGNEPEGPMSTAESKIQPLYDNQTKAFKSRVDNFEWRTRGADYQGAAIHRDYAGRATSQRVDDYEKAFTQEDGSKITYTQGYADNRDKLFGGQFNPENTVFSWTTPGFHSFSMDDRVENCRIRLRTTSGTQVILDDTNERIYVNTSSGNTWVEIDEDGSVDIFTTEKLSASAKHINLTAEETIRLYGKKGVHIRTDADLRMQVGENFHTTVTKDTFFTTTDYHKKIKGSDFETVDFNKQVNVGGYYKIQVLKSYSVLSNGNDGVVFTCSDFHVKATRPVIIRSGVAIFENAPVIKMNSGGAPSPSIATKGTDATLPKEAFYVNRYPLHEPWGRTGTKHDFTIEPKYQYNDPMVGREHKRRGTFWRR